MFYLFYKKQPIKANTIKATILKANTIKANTIKATTNFKTLDKLKIFYKTLINL
jgi:hypothetical protein